MKKGNWSTWLLSAVFCIGLGLLMYPSVANWWNEKVSTKAIIGYDEAVSSMSEEEYENEFNKAREYNEALRQVPAPLVNYDQVAGYEQMLNIGGMGVMGYIEIPKIDVKLPVYHGVSASVLNSAAGHLPGSSLPVGGIGTHSVISAHRGLPSAKLFTYLDKLKEGDIFILTVLNEQLTYQVDQIRIVAPSETNDLRIDSQQDYVTLLTCTPYGINTDRLLVRGHRIDNLDPDNIAMINEAIELDNLLLAPVIAVPILIILFVFMLTGGGKPKKKFDPIEVLHPKDASEDEASN